MNYDTEKTGGFRGGFRKGRGGFIRKGYSGKPSNYGPKTKHDPTKICQYCKQTGHNIDECWKRQRNNQNNQDNGDTEYRPTANFQVDVTRYSANTVSATPTKDPYKWMIDSASNANLTPFKFRLQSYKPFIGEFPTVHGIGGKSVPAHGSGSITLTDDLGYKHMIENILYVPEQDTAILSLMKIGENGIHFILDSDVTKSGDFSLISHSTNFKLAGKAIDHILYVT